MADSVASRFRVRALTIRAATALFGGIAVAMHLLRPEVSPLASEMSQYQRDLYGNLMDAGYLMLGLAMGTAAYEIRKARRPGAPLLFGAAIASLVAAALPLRVGARESAVLLHHTAVFVMIAGAIGSVTVATGAFQPDRSARFFGPVALAMARTAAITGTLYLLSVAAARTELRELLGLLQRLTLAAIAVWMIAITRRA